MKKNYALEKAAPFKYRCEWGNRFNSTSSPLRKLASNSHDHPLFNQFLHGSFVFFTTTFPCFQIWKFIQLKHPLKMGCLGQISRLHANTRCATQRRGDVGTFWPEKKRGDIIFFKEGGSWGSWGHFPLPQKKWWANNMSPTSFLVFFGGGGLTKHSFLWKDLGFQTS